MASENPVLAANEIVLFGQVRALQPLKGRKARLMMPRILAFAASAVQSLIIGDFDLLGIVDRIGASEKGMDVFADIAQIVQFLMTALRGKWEEFDHELLPFLLQVEPEALESEGEPVEVYLALARAVRWYMQKSITPEQKAAFRAVLDNMAKNARPRESSA